jgi:nicotinate-nucleotide adenylyltransferase
LLPRTAIFGGTFDPVHNTHLAIAQQAADTFSLDKVIFVPAGNPPLKAGTQASYEDRVAMLELAVAGDSRFEVSRIEEPTAHGGSRSYSILTVEALNIHPVAFIVGADAFADIQKWYRWQDLVQAVTFIVVPRPGAAYVTPPNAEIYELPPLSSPVSSSLVRARINEPNIPVPGSVLAYIHEHALYQSQVS